MNAKPRWVRKDARVYDFSTCKLCGVAYGIPEHGACRVARCLACGTEQCACGLSDKCMVCYHGILDGFRGEKCGKANCGRQAVARAPRIGAACGEHLASAKAAKATGAASMLELIQRYLGERAKHWHLLS